MYVAWGTNTAGLVIFNTNSFYNNTGDISSALFLLGTNDVTFLAQHQRFSMTNIEVVGSRQLSGSLLNSSLQKMICCHYPECGYCYFYWSLGLQ